MINNSKLRMSVGMFYPITIFSCYIIAIVEWSIRRYLIQEGEMISQVPFFTYYICAVFFFIMGIYQYFKYRLWPYLIISIIVAFLCVQGPSLIAREYIFPKATYFGTFIILGLIILVNWKTIYAQERYELNARRLFKLAANLITDISDGFTERPYAAGNFSTDREQLLGFARYLEGKYISRCIHKQKDLYLLISLNRSILTTDDPVSVSHILIQESGKMTVYITKADYHQFRRRYNFNQLCESLGDVFIRFYNYYQEGRDNRIYTELKTAR